jgi:hypothetical protein
LLKIWWSEKVGVPLILSKRNNMITNRHISSIFEVLNFEPIKTYKAIHPASSYYQMGVGRIHEPGYAVEYKEFGNFFLDGLCIEVVKKAETLYVADAFSCKFHESIWIREECFDDSVENRRKKLHEILQRNEEPSDELKKLVRKIWTKEIAGEGKFFAAFSILSNRRLSLLNRRWIASKMLESGHLNEIDILNNFNYLF